MRERARLRAMLVSGGMTPPTNIMASVLELLDATRVLRSSLPIGSHAFAAYEGMLGVKSDKNLLETRDIDIGADLRMVRQGDLEVGTQLARAGFLEIPSLNHATPASSWQLPGKARIDFLVPMVGKGSGAPVRLPGLGVDADELRYLDYLIEEPAMAVLLTKYGLLVQVPQPARYAIHKLLVAGSRPPSERAKIAKDIGQASHLIEFFLQFDPHALASAWGAMPWPMAAAAGMAMLEEQYRQGLAECGARV